MIAQDLLDMLVCPVCKTPVVLNDSGTGLKCGQCRRLYPIQDDIPVMLVDAAKIEGAQLESSVKACL
ncbi:MAG: Trm112 family protein [Terriglobales bacterium]